ncbi:MAG: molybdate ABC transporter substrate-binding protein [Phycisphaerales bacterium]|nr:molybdate ABC transporter substrate-binding protein [Phycisphaerales bacterium]
MNPLRRPQTAFVPLALACAALAALLGGCGPSGKPAPPEHSHRRTPTEIVVSVPSSLAPAVEATVPAFETARPDIKVLVNSGSSGALTAQTIAGAPTDLVLTADPRWMAALVAAGRLQPDDVRPLAGNTLVLAVPAASTVAFRDLVDLLTDDFSRIAIGDPEVAPVGSYARTELTNHGLWRGVEPKAVFAPNARQALDWVVRGEVDAGFLFRSDALSAGDAVRILAELPLPETVYEVALPLGGPHPREAQLFMDHLLGESFKETLKQRGFRVD